MKNGLQSSVESGADVAVVKIVLGQHWSVHDLVVIDDALIQRDAGLIRLPDDKASDVPGDEVASAYSARLGVSAFDESRCVRSAPICRPRCLQLGCDEWLSRSAPIEYY